MSKVSGSKRKAQKVPPPRHGYNRPVEDSNDVGVEVEIRAAELAVQMETGRFDGFTDDEAIGYWAHSSSTSMAGWLARQICLHRSIIARDGYDDLTAESRIISAISKLGEDAVPPDGWEEKVLAAVHLDGIPQSAPTAPDEASTDPDSEHTQPMAPLVDIGGES